MLNDRFNSGSKNDLGSKFRDKKFVSAVAIGVFVLILFIVLIAKGCSSKKRTAKRQTRTVQTGNAGAPAGGAQQSGVQPGGATVAGSQTGVTTPTTTPAVRPAATGRRTTPPRPAAGSVDELIRKAIDCHNGTGGQKQDFAAALKYFELAKRRGARKVNGVSIDVWIQKCRKHLRRR